MTNKGATVKLTEKQRETLDRLARDLGYGYVGLSFVRPNTWRSLVAAGLVQECVTERGMFKLTEQGCAAAGVKPTYMSNVRNAEAFAVIEHLRRGNDSAMRTAEAANLRDSQVLLDPYLNRHGVVGTELVNGRTRLWLVELDQPTLSPKWIDTDPESMNIFFARAEGRPAPTFMRRSDSGLLFRVLGSDGGGVHLVAVNDAAYELHRDLDALVTDDWTATDYQGVPYARQALRAWVTGANTALAKTVCAVASDEAAAFVESKPLDLTTPQAGCPAGNSCTGAAFPGHPAHAIESDGVDEILHMIDNPPTAKELADRRNAEALEGVLETDDGYHVIGEVPRGKPAVEGVTSSYWVVPVSGDRLTDRHDVLGPYAGLDMAEWKRDQHIEAGHPCRVVQSVTRPTLLAIPCFDPELPAPAPRVWSVGPAESPSFLAIDSRPAQPARPFAVGDQVVQLDGTPAEVTAVINGIDRVRVLAADGQTYEHTFDELSLLDPDDPRGRPKTSAELADDRRSLSEQLASARQHLNDSVIPARVVTMTLTEYIATVAVTVSAVRRAALLQERAGC